MLNRYEAEQLLAAHVSDVLEWHRLAYKRRTEAMTRLADQWADQRPALHGQWTNGLIRAAARADEADGRAVVTDGHAEVVRLSAPSGEPVAQLRFLRVKLAQPFPGSPLVPEITGRLTRTAKSWFGNDHARSWQLDLFGDQGETPYTNLLVGHTADTVVGELGQVFVGCYTGARLSWFFELGGEADVSPFRETEPHDPVLPITPRRVRIQPKGKESR